MTVKLYWEDQYMKSFDAVVESVENGIVLDRTAFYPTGGGQPCDTGKLVVDGVEAEVRETRKDGEDIIHVVDALDGIRAGAKVMGTIDWERRYAHMRHHTLLHIVDGIVEKFYNGKVTGGQIYQDKARMDFDVPMMDKAKAADIVSKVQGIVAEGHNVVQKMLTPDEARLIPNLSRTLPGNELLKKLEIVRVIDIEGFDMQLDGGTHVSNTKEIGTITLESYESRGAHNKRIVMSSKL